MMVKLSNKIDEMLLLYEDCYRKSLERVKIIIKKANHSLLQDVDEKYVVRYMDDIVIFSNSKEWLRETLGKIQEYLHENLNLQVK